MSRHERLTRLAITLAATALVAVACTTQPRTSTATEQPQATAAARPATTAAAAAPTPTFQPQEVTGAFALEPKHGPWDTKVTATASGPVGTPITVEVRGIGWQSYQNSFQLAYDNAYTGWVSSITTDGYGKVVIPATGAPGTHYITLGHSEFGAPYLNPQQQPVVASRPFPHIAFTVTDGLAVRPAPASQQGFPTIAAKPVDKGIWTAPAGATVGTPATLNAKALPANSDVEVVWTTMVGNRSVTGFEERTKTLGKTKTDAAGTFTWAFNVPD